MKETSTVTILIHLTLAVSLPASGATIAVNTSRYFVTELFTKSITVTSGGARNRIGGPQVPVPLLT